MSAAGVSAADAVFGRRDVRLVAPNPLLVEHYPPNVVVSRRGVPGTFVGVGRGGKSRKLAGGLYVDLEGRQHVAGLALRASREDWDFVDAPAGLIAPRAGASRLSEGGRAPSAPPVDLALLSSWGVPRCVVERYAAVAGIHRLHDWQVDLLRSDCCSVMRGCNAVYSAPTSGGKTLVAEIAMLRCVLRRRKKAMLVVPYRALCVEKARHLDAMFGEGTLQLRVGSFFSSSGGTSMHAVDIGVCTIERGASLLNQLVSAGKFDTLGCIVVDEGHMLSEGPRGAVLECMLAKVKALAKHVPVEVDEAALAATPSVEVPTTAAAAGAGNVTVGVAGGADSAPIPIDVDLEDEHDEAEVEDASDGHVAAGRNHAAESDVDMAVLQSAADGGTVTAAADAAAGSTAAGTSTERDNRSWVSLRSLLPAPSAPWVQLIVMSATLSNLPLLASWLGASYHASGTRPVQLTEYLCIDNVIDCQDSMIETLAAETAQRGRTVLVFCSSKARVKSLALLLAETFAAPGRHPGVEHFQKERKASLQALDAQLDMTPCGRDGNLSRCLMAGVAFHHGDLTMEEREVVEHGMRSGALAVLVATTTLAAGVNLPAQRVIFDGIAEYNYAVISESKYRQMAGRAGRTGLDTRGEVIVVVSTKAAAQLGDSGKAGNAVLPDLVTPLWAHGAGDATTTATEPVTPHVANIAVPADHAGAAPPPKRRKSGAGPGDWLPGGDGRTCSDAAADMAPSALGSEPTVESACYQWLHPTYTFAPPMAAAMVPASTLTGGTGTPLAAGAGRVTTGDPFQFRTGLRVARMWLNGMANTSAATSGAARAPVPATGRAGAADAHPAAPYGSFFAPANELAGAALKKRLQALRDAPTTVPSAAGASSAIHQLLPLQQVIERAAAVVPPAWPTTGGVRAAEAVARYWYCPPGRLQSALQSARLEIGGVPLGPSPAVATAGPVDAAGKRPVIAGSSSVSGVKRPHAGAATSALAIVSAAATPAAASGVSVGAPLRPYAPPYMHRFLLELICVGAVKRFDPDTCEELLAASLLYAEKMSPMSSHSHGVYHVAAALSDESSACDSKGAGIVAVRDTDARMALRGLVKHALHDLQEFRMIALATHDAPSTPAAGLATAAPGAGAASGARASASTAAASSTAPAAPPLPFRWCLLPIGKLDEPCDVLCLPFGFATFRSGYPPLQAHVLTRALLHACADGLDLSDELHLLQLLTQSVTVAPAQTRAAVNVFEQLLASDVQPAPHAASAAAGASHAGRVGGRGARGLPTRYRDLIHRGIKLCGSTTAYIRDPMRPRTAADVPRSVVAPGVAGGGAPAIGAVGAVDPEDMKLGKLRNAIVLVLLLREEPLPSICAAFGLERGDVQRLQTEIASHAGMVCALVELLPGFEVLGRVLAKFAARLEFGVQPELLPLMGISSDVTPLRARHLHEAGLETPEDVAAATPEAVRDALLRYVQYRREGDTAPARGGTGTPASGRGSAAAAPPAGGMAELRAQALDVARRLIDAAAKSVATAARKAALVS